MKEHKDGCDAGRRAFLKRLGAGAAVVASSSLVGCKDSSAKVKYVAEGVGGDVPKDKMEYRKHPCGDSVSLLGYGMMRLPMKKDDSGADVIDQERVNELVDYAIEHGVNYFDTAPVYCRGKSEQATGIALSRHPRNKYFIATKLSNMRGNNTLEFGKEMFNNSLKELQVDYIDYLLLHSLGNLDAYKKRFIDNGLLDYLLEQQKKGVIRNLGWSFHGSKEFFDYMLDEAGVKWDFIQIQMNYVDWERGNPTAEYMYKRLTEKGIPVVIMEPLLGGSLATMNYQAMALLKERAPEASVASWAFRFVGSFDNVLTALSGMTYMEHLQDNIRTYSPLRWLSDEEFALLSDVARRKMSFRNVDCTDCKYCMPCPYGLDIPSIFKHYNRCLNEGAMPQNELDEDYREQRRAFLIGLDRTVPRMRQADKCVGCRECEPHCPQKIKIAREMRRIDEFVQTVKGDGLI